MTDKPTMEIDEYGNKVWKLNGKYHRGDGPACEYADGTKFWCLKGKRHREDGPAIEWPDGDKAWYLNDEEVTEEEVMRNKEEPTMEIDDFEKVTVGSSFEDFLEDTLDVIARLGQDFDASDNVNSPSHYNQSGIECIDAIKASLGDSYQDYCKGNVMKYLWRYKYKNGIEDLKKAQWYLNSMVESVEENND